MLSTRKRILERLGILWNKVNASANPAKSEGVG